MKIYILVKILLDGNLELAILFGYFEGRINGKSFVVLTLGKQEFSENQVEFHPRKTEFYINSGRCYLCEVFFLRW